MNTVHAIEFKNITKRFGKKVIANNNIDLYVDKGVVDKVNAKMPQHMRINKVTKLNEKNVMTESIKT